MTKNRGFLRKVTDAARAGDTWKVRDFIAVEKNRPESGGQDLLLLEVVVFPAHWPEEPTTSPCPISSSTSSTTLASAIRLAQLDSPELQHTSSFLDSVLVKVRNHFLSRR